MRLQPLLSDLKDVRIGRGRYEVQLEMPRTSTLAEKDIKKIMRLSTWTVNPCQEAVDFEGVRSVLVEKEIPVKRGPIELKGLQISGIGYRKFDASKVLQDDSDKSFYPPSQENFMNHMVGTKMSTSYACGSQMISTKPKYRALGTYTHTELKEKLTKTMDVSTLKLEKMVVPHVEAYGRYLDSELQGKDGGFGFMVFPVPDAKKQRASIESFESFTKIASEKKLSPPETVMAYYYLTASYICPLVDGLRELHDKGRRVHLQPHMGNYYLVDKKPYVMDWSTTRKLGKDKEENILNRTIDIHRPVVDYETMFSSAFPRSPERFKKQMVAQVNGVVMEVYSQHPEKEIDIGSVVERTFASLRYSPSDVEVIAHWMKESGIEGYNERLDGHKRKISRNEPCPCGSGTKYKRCCGRY